MPLSQSRNESPAAKGSRRLGPPRRLRRPAEFAAVLAAPRARGFRAARHWLSMTAAWMLAPESGVRFGATVGKRNARRAVDRALVKRILREAGRDAAPSLEALSAVRGLRVDVAFRLKAVRLPGTDDQPSVAAWRRILREEADWLLDRLGRHLEQSVEPPGAGDTA